MKKRVSWSGFVTQITLHPSLKVNLTPKENGWQAAYKNILSDFRYLVDKVKHVYLSLLRCKTANHVLTERKKKGSPV